MALLMNQRLHDFNKRVHREVFRIEGDFINHPAAAVSSNKAPVTEIAHCVLAALERNQTVRGVRRQKGAGYRNQTPVVARCKRVPWLLSC